MNNSGVLDEAFERWKNTGPEFGPGLSNHGPMASEALVTMGRSDAVERWSAWYAPRLRERASPRNAVSATNWREALGQIERVADWVTFFDRELSAAPWPEVLDRWMLRLAPGSMATHGLLRTAHAVRALESASTGPRLHELAEGLGYWAARYQELPGQHLKSGSLRVAEALQRVERVAPNKRRGGLFIDAVRQVDSTDFSPVIDLVSTDIPFDDFISDLTCTFVQRYLANADHASFAFIHTVTAPSALRLIAPHVATETSRTLMVHMWQSCAAMDAVFARTSANATTVFANAVEDEADLIDRTVAARDEHAIKFVEACLREHRLSGESAFVIAARDAITRLAVAA